MGDDGGFGAGGVHVAGMQGAPRLHQHRDLPQLVGVDGGHRHAPVDKIAGQLLDGLQGPLDTVEDVVENAGTQRGAQRAARGVHRFPDLQAGGVFIYLDGGRLGGDADDLAHQLFLAHQHHFHHGQAGIAQHCDDGAVDAKDCIHTKSPLILRSSRRSWRTIPVGCPA